MSRRWLSLGALVAGLAVLSFSVLADLLISGSAPGFGFEQGAGVLAGLLLLLLGTLLSASRRRFLRRSVIVAISPLLGLAVLVLVGWYPASTEQGVGFAYDRTTGPARIREVVNLAGLPGTGICVCRPDTVAQLRLPGGFATRIAIFQQPGGQSRPGILLIHGNTWRGQQLSTYRLIATLLARRGYIVATFDKPGFGQADDPFGRGPAAVAAAFDRVAQVRAAIDYLTENTAIDPQDISVFGHSGGVGQALRVGRLDPRTSAVIVMVAPPPPAKEGDDAEPRSAYFSRRFRDQYQLIYRHAVPSWFSWDLTRLDEREKEDPWVYYESSDHKPLLVLLGERDEPAGHEAVYDRFARLVEPRKLALIRRSDHYGNTAQSLGLVFYDRGVARQLVNEVDTWLQNRPGRRAGTWHGGS